MLHQENEEHCINEGTTRARLLPSSTISSKDETQVRNSNFLNLPEQFRVYREPVRDIISDTDSESTMTESSIEKLTQLMESIKQDIATLAKENENRSREIREVYQVIKDRSDRITTEDDAINDEARLPAPPAPPAAPAERRPAKEIIRTIEVLKGRDDIGIEDFIKQTKRAALRCLEPELLLDLILVEKIQEQAKRSIRFLIITSYDELYSALRTHVNPPTTIGNCRQRLSNTKQGATESVQSFNLRFRQNLNELQYAVQNKHSNAVARSIALESENDNATHVYILNLRHELGKLVIARSPPTISEAQSIACEMEMWLREGSRMSNANASLGNRYKSGNQHPTPRSIKHSSIPSTSSRSMNDSEKERNQSRSTLQCEICKRYGHTKERCYSRNFRDGQPGKLPPRVNNIEEENPQENAEENHEYFVPPEDYGTYEQNSEEWKDPEDSYLTPEQE